MLDSFKGQSKKIIVGVQFHEETANVLKSTASLAERSGMTLCLTHAGELPAIMHDVSDGELRYGVVYGSEEQSKRDGLALLEGLARDLDAKIARELVCEVGPPATILMAEAERRKASLIVCGLKPWTHKFVPRGLSTVLTLMAESPIPVLAIPNSQVFDFNPSRNQGTLTILAADDLREDTLHAIGTACELALNLGRTRLIHLHIHRQTREEMEETANKITEALMMYELEKDPRYSPENLYKTMSEKIKMAMDSRLGVLETLVASQRGGSYEQRVLFGDVFDRFKEAIDEYDPDLIVFGRHRMVHRKPLSMGKMPAYAMLGLSRPIMSVGAEYSWKMSSK